MKKQTTRDRITTRTAIVVAELESAQLARVHGGQNGWSKAAVPPPAGTTDGNDPWP